MTSDRHAIPGWTVVHSRDVVLPIYRITIDVVAQIERVLPPLSEFVLRSIGSGLTTPIDVAAFLGLDGGDAQAAIVELIRDDLVTLVRDASEDGEHLTGDVSLTPKGRRLVTGGGLTRTEEVRIEVDYDGLLRRPVARRSWLLRPREAREEGFFEIPASPSRAPKLLELEPADVMQALHATPREAHVEILAISRILRSERRYVPALLLVYRKDRAKEVRPVFKVADLEQEEHRVAFVAAGGIERLNLEKASVNNKEGIKAAATAVLLAPIRRARQKSQDADLSPRTRLLPTYEHPRMLDASLKQCSQRLIIISPWLKNAVVNPSFITKLRCLLEKDVDIYIGWGLGEQVASDSEAIKRLTELSERFSTCRVEYFGDTHVKALVCDDRFAIVGSFNWLSFRGDPNMPFRDERGYLVTNPAVVAETAADLLERFSG